MSYIVRPSVYARARKDSCRGNEESYIEWAASWHHSPSLSFGAQEKDREATKISVVTILIL